METLKSHSSFCFELLSKILTDSNPYTRNSYLEADRAYIARRLDSEGIGFVTKCLPAFGKHILRSIEVGAFTPYPAFRRGKGLFPKFLSGWTERIFASDGTVDPNMDPYYLQEILQICMLFYKLETESTKDQISRTVDSFVITENELQAPSEEVHLDSSILGVARNLIWRLLRGFDPLDIKPAHGPGAVATGETGNRKYYFTRKYQRLHQKFPYYRYFAPSLSRLGLESGWYSRLLPQLNSVAKVVLVPKDSRGPRLISMEPLETQWIQQGILRKLVPHIESRMSCLPGHINFTDQSFNQRVALSSSLTKEYSTLDMKDASDRVSLALFRSLYPSDIVEAFEACRSTATELPDGRVLPLRKFAPMGSALCFPVLAMTIWSIAVAATLSLNLDASGVAVYGDDLIIPSAAYSEVVKNLESAGLKVNTDKSYLNSHYRESCGVDAYHGTIVTPIRVKRIFNEDILDTRVYEHLIALSESFFNKGFWKTSDFLRKEVLSHWNNVPWTHDGSYPGFYCPDREVCKDRNSTFKWRYNPNLQRHEVLVRTVDTQKEESMIPPESQLLKGLLGLYAVSCENYQVALRRKSVFRMRYRT